MSDRNGGTSENENRQRLDQMQNVVQSMITLAHEHGKLHEQILAEIREQRGEIQDLIALQKEHRIDIMALFELQKKQGEAGL